MTARPRLAWIGLGLLAGAGLVLPLVGLALAALEARGAPVADPAAVIPGRPTGVVLRDTLAWSLGVAAGAMLLGWLPGRALGRTLGGGGTGRLRRAAPLLAAMLLVPMAIPSYASFYAWWQAWPPGGPLHDWARTRGLVGALRQVTLAVSLVLWAWPITAWCVALPAARRSAGRESLLRLDGAGRLRRCLDAAREEWPAALLGGAIAGALTAGTVSAFDLAQVIVAGNELRALDATGAPLARLLPLALPAGGLAVLVGLAGWRGLARDPHRATRGAPGRVAAPGRASLLLLAGLWTLSVLVPALLLARGLGAAGSLGTYLDLYGASLARSIGRAALSATLVGLLAATLLALEGSGGRGARRVAAAVTVGFAALALVPGTLVAAGLESALNRAVVGPELGGSPAGSHAGWILPRDLYRSPVVILLGQLAVVGAVGAVLARWAGARTSAGERARRRLDAPRGLRDRVAAAGPAARAAVLAAALLALPLALGRVDVVARVHPPGSDPIGVRLLAAMHYQRPEVVVRTAVVLLALALLAVAAAAGVLVGVRRTRAIVPVLLAATLLAAGPVACAPVEDDGAGRGASAASFAVSADDLARGALPADLAFGGPGTSPGRFDYPRAVASDPERRRLYVIDKTARVQVFDEDGGLLGGWRMPAWDRGKPTGVSVGPDGTVWVADTHEQRVMGFAPDGTERIRFGAMGEGPGQFVYPTDVAFGADGRLYVSEYGGNDRVQVFAPDGTPLASFGRFGPERDAFNRPQALLFDAAGTELFIADACNHRIVVTDPEGVVRRILGGAGREPGRLHYPYDVAWAPDGTLLVPEFGNERVSRLDPETGACLGMHGVPGTDPGTVRYPWGVAMIDQRLFVLDSGNDRVQRVPWAALLAAPSAAPIASGGDA